MARAKAAERKKQARVVAGPAVPGVAHSAGQAFGRVLRTLAPVLLLGLLYAGVAALLWVPLRNDPRATLSRETLYQALLQVKGRPAYVGEAEVRKIAQLGVAVQGRSVFEAGLAQDLARAYETSPWIEQVGAVRLRYPAAVRVEAPRWRVPYARLESEGGPLVIDRQGWVLPMHAGDLAVPSPAGSLPGRMALPSLGGVSAGKREAGERLVEREVAEGLDLLSGIREVLQRSPGGWKAVRAQHDRAGSWLVFLSHGSVVELEWGCGNDEDRPVGEPAIREKKEALARRLAECDAGRWQAINLRDSRAPVTLLRAPLKPVN